MGPLLILAGVSSWVRSRFNWESYFCVRVVSLVVGGLKMLTTLFCERIGFLVSGGVGIIPAVRADSISLRRCSRAAVFFCSALRSLFCWLKSKAFCFGNGSVLSHSCFSSHIGAMGLFTQARLNAFQIVVFPFHLFCQQCLGILI